MAKPEAEFKLLNEVFGYKSRIMSREKLHQTVIRDEEAAGALMEPDGISIHAAKLASGYMKLARKLGVKIHPASPVMGWKTVNGVNHLATPGGTVRAKTVALATAGHCATITVFFRTAACRSAAAVP
jgi:taurine dehydrogenase large subunit